MGSDLSSWAARALEHLSGATSGPPLDRSLRITLNFHPERQVAGLTAHPGGARWRWEQRIFAHAYDDAPEAERPKYGALNHRRRRIGAAPRFGSAHLRLREAVLDRSTFCFPDSVFDPTAMATAARFDLFSLVEAFDARQRSDEVEAVEGGLLDDYVEAHFHGPIDVGADVEAVVLDPCFRDSPIKEQARALGVPVEWHDGRRLRVETLDEHPWFRGPDIVEVGRRIARDGALDALVIGAAVLAGSEDPGDLKKLWHHVARFGSPTGA